MNSKLAFLLSGFYKSTSRVSENVIAEVQKKTGFEFPPDYLDVMREFDGGEGDLGENGFLILFSLEETVQANKDYSIIMTQIPDYYLIGKDAADTGFAFYKPDRSMHSLGLTAVYPSDPIIRVGNNFSEFLEFLYNS